MPNHLTSLQRDAQAALFAIALRHPEPTPTSLIRELLLGPPRAVNSAVRAAIAMLIDAGVVEWTADTQLRMTAFGLEQATTICPELALPAEALAEVDQPTAGFSELEREMLRRVVA